MITCPGCYEEVEEMPVDDEGQVTCPKCGGFYPAKFARDLEEFEAKRGVRKVKVSDLKRGHCFMWKSDLAIVHDIVSMPEHFFTPTHGMMYSMDVEVPDENWRGAVQVLGSTEVELVKCPAGLREKVGR